MYKTVIQKVNQNSLTIARDIIIAGGAVAFPTETVYGLGANAFNDSALQNIYKIKNRPSDNPLIVHVHKDYDISSLVYDDKEYIKSLRQAFLPGALTLVYKSKNTVSKFVCATNTLAIRVPSHPDAQKFLQFVNLPIAAPSANISKHVSPVTASHVLKDLNGKVLLILDGGMSNCGIESTVLDVTKDIPVILRAGSVTQNMIKQVVGACEVAQTFSQLKSPGIAYSHYMPNTQTIYFTKNQINDAKIVYDICLKNNQTVCVMCDEGAAGNFLGLNVYNLGATSCEIAQNLYNALRDAEEKYSLIIAIELDNHNSSDYDGIINRFNKAFSVK